MQPTIAVEMSMGEIVARYPQTRRTMEALGLDYCGSGGRRTLEQGALEAGRDPREVARMLTEAAAATPENPSDYPSLSLTELADRIVRTHHVYLRKHLPRLTILLARLLRAHGQHHDESLRRLEETLLRLRDEIAVHLHKEERILFPYIRQIDAWSDNRGSRPEFRCGTLADPIRQMEAEHDEEGAALKRLREITADYTPPCDACENLKALYDGLRELELDLRRHIHLENSILFPAALEMETRMHHGQNE